MGAAESTCRSGQAAEEAPGGGGGGGGASAAAAGGRRTRPGPASVHIDSLPDDLLSMLFELAGRDAAASLAAVCKRWAAVVWSTPALWRELTIHAGPRLVAAPAELERWFAAKQALLRRVAPLLESLQLSTCKPGGPSGGPTAAHCRLAAAYVCALLSSLAQAARLTQLKLNAWGLVLRPQYMRLLAGLPRLQSLAIQWPDEFAAGPPPGRCCLLSTDGGWDLAAAVAQMTALQRLTLPAASVPAPLLTAIAGLGGLSSLTLSSQQPLPAAVAGLVGTPALKELRLHEKDVRDAGGLQLPAGTSQLSMLHVAAPNIQIGGGQVFSCQQATLVGLERSQCPCCGMSTVAVVNACWNSCAPALDVVEAAGGGGGVLEHLILSHCHLSAGGLAPAPLTPAQQLSLSRTRRLEVTRCHGGADIQASVHAELRALVEQLPALQDLELRALHLDPAALPALLGAATALAGLTLQDCGLADLPAGGFLAGLDTLSLAHNQLTAVPTSLRFASGLTRLQLAGNPLEMSFVDVSGVLARLPELEALSLGGSATTSGAAWAHLSELGVEVTFEAESDDESDDDDEGGE